MTAKQQYPGRAGRLLSAKCTGPMQHLEFITFTPLLVNQLLSKNVC